MPLKKDCLNNNCDNIAPACVGIPGAVHGETCPCTNGEIVNGKVKISMLEVYHGLTYKGIKIFKYFPTQRYGDSLAYSLFDVNLDESPDKLDQQTILDAVQLKDMGQDMKIVKEGVMFATMKKQSYHAEVVSDVANTNVIPVDDVSRFAKGYTLIYYIDGNAGDTLTTAYGDTFQNVDGSDVVFADDCCLVHDTVLITDVDPVDKTITVDQNITVAEGSRVVLGSPNVDISGITACGDIQFPSMYYEDDVELETALWQYTAGEFKVNGDHLRETCVATEDKIYNMTMQRFLRRSKPMYETIYRGISMSKYISRNVPAVNGRGSETMGIDTVVKRGRQQYGLVNDVFIKGSSIQEKAAKLDKYLERATEEVYMTPDGSTPTMLALCTKEMFTYITSHILPAIHTLRKSSAGCVGTYSCDMAQVVKKRMKIYNMETNYGLVEFLHDPILDDLKGPGAKEFYHVPRHQIGIVFKPRMNFGEGENWRNVSLAMPEFPLVDDLDDPRRKKTANIQDCEVTYSVAIGYAIPIIGGELHGIGHVAMS